jgi:enterochelin esterase-like enzyme
MHAYAPVVHAAIEDGRLGPAMLVGIETGEHRHLEYLAPRPEWLAISGGDTAEHEARHRAHRRFVLDDVARWIDRAVGDDAGPVLLQGNSNGAAWALDLCHDEPERCAGAIAFSVAGMAPVGPLMANPGARHVLAAGTLEAGFLSTTEAWHDALTAAGSHATIARRVNGHDWRFWRDELVGALALIGA